MWLRHWGLAHDPFGATPAPYVPLPSHDEALARLVFSIERQRRLITFFAGAGLGKTTVVRRAIDETRNPRRRFVLVTAPSGGHDLLGLLADGLGFPSAVGSDRERVWRTLSRALRAAAIEGRQVIFVVDGWDRDADSASMRDLMALLDLAGPNRPSPSLVRVGRVDDESEGDDPWTLAIGLERLTRSESQTYLEARLSSAGCRDRILTPRAMTRLHSWSEGVPRALDQLAGFSLIAGATQGLEVVTADVVDGVALRSLVGVNSG